MKPALFLDRDGIVNEDRDFVCRSEDFHWQDGIFDLVRAGIARGFLPVVVTNQSGIGRGFYTEETFQQLTRWMCDRFAREDAAIARVYHCPFLPNAPLLTYRADHPWRKPSPGMLLAARDDLGLDLEGSVLVGDRWSDMKAADAAGLRIAALVGQKAERPANLELSPGLEVVRHESVRAASDWFATVRPLSKRLER